MKPTPSSPTTPADAEKVKRLKVALQRLVKESPPLETILRVKALIAYYKGWALPTVAACYDVSEKSVKNWIKRFEEEGEDGLDDKPRSGRPVRLPPEQAAELKALIEHDHQRVWTARHVWVSLMTTFSVCYSVKYLPALLRKLGLSFHKAVHELIRKNTQKRREWVQTKLPTIFAAHIAEGWRIFFQDEVGFQTEGTLAYSWGPKGQPIEIKNYGRHGRVNLLGAFELGTGVFCGVLTTSKVTAVRFRRFICHLKHEMRTDKILLICDKASFHKAKWLQDWFSPQAAWLRIEFLPAYSPDFNPIERLWHWFKGEFTHNACWPTQAALAQHLIEKLAELPQHKSAMLGVMRQEIARLKAAFEFYDTPFPELQAAA
jgi:putative transposase